MLAKPELSVHDFVLAYGSQLDREPVPILENLIFVAPGAEILSVVNTLVVDPLSLLITNDQLEVPIANIVACVLGTIA